MHIRDACANQRVRYTPHHARGNPASSDIEYGTVVAARNQMIFIKFDANVARLGWEGATAKGCHPDDVEAV